jgi:hypothetical protein
MERGEVEPLERSEECVRVCVREPPQALENVLLSECRELIAQIGHFAFSSPPK